MTNNRNTLSRPRENELQKVTVLYNSACPVCNSGIRFQQHRIDSESVSWIDISQQGISTLSVQSDIEFIKERLHAVDDSGQVNIGIDAFIVLWRLSPKDQFKARFFSLPIVHPVARIFYNVFANILYQWNRWLKRW